MMYAHIDSILLLPPSASFCLLLPPSSSLHLPQILPIFLEDLESVGIDRKGGLGVKYVIAGTNWTYVFFLNLVLVIFIYVDRNLKPPQLK